MPSSPDASSDDFYHLGFQRIAEQTLLSYGQSAQQGDRLKLVLTSSALVLEKRWVYILDIDCRGQGSLIYPTHYSENRFPNDADDQRQIVLPGGPTLKVGAPFGLDTVLMISTTEPLKESGIGNVNGAAPHSILTPSSTNKMMPKVATTWSR